MMEKATYCSRTYWKFSEGLAMQLKAILHG